MYTFDFSWLPENLPRLIDGAIISLWLTLVTAPACFAIGVIAGQMRMSKLAIVRIPAAAYIDLFRTTPFLVQLVFFFFLLPLYFPNMRFDAVSAGCVALSLNYGAFFAEIFRAGVTSLGRAQEEAALALGMTRVQSARRIIYPQAVRRMLPPIGSMFVSLLKDTSLLSVVGVAELMNTGQNIGAVTFRNLEVLMVVGALYFILTYPIALWANRLHDRASAHS